MADGVCLLVFDMYALYCPGHGFSSLWPADYNLARLSGVCRRAWPGVVWRQRHFRRRAYALACAARIAQRLTFAYALAGMTPYLKRHIYTTSARASRASCTATLRAFLVSMPCLSRGLFALPSGFHPICLFACHLMRTAPHWISIGIERPCHEYRILFKANWGFAHIQYPVRFFHRGRTVPVLRLPASSRRWLDHAHFRRSRISLHDSSRIGCA